MAGIPTSNSVAVGTSARQGQSSYRFALIALTSLFFMWGFITCLNDILVPHLKNVFSLNYAQSMLIQLCFFGAYFIVSLPAGALVKRITYKWGIVVGLVFSLFTPLGIEASLIGAALGAGILLAVRWIWRKLRGVDAMGLGDVKMLAMIGAFLGWRQIWVVLFVASLTGAAVGVLLTMRQGRSMQARLPFGTFLAIAAYVASIVGERLLSWYLGLYA